MRMHKVDVSPHEPGMVPKKASANEIGFPSASVRTVLPPVDDASCPNGVAPVKPSMAFWPSSATNTWSPLILAG